MDGAAMILAFKIYYDRITSFSAPGYRESEILIFLNNAQDDFVRDSVFGKNFRPPAIDDNQQRGVELSPLLTTYNASPTAVSEFGATAFKPDTILVHTLYFLDVKAKYSRLNPTISDEYVECEEIKNESASKFVVSATNKTHFIKPKYFRNHNDLIVLFDSHYTGSSRISYTIVREPYPITAASIEFTESYAIGVMSLHPSVHQKVVDIAVRQALQVTQDPRWKTSVQEQEIKTN